MAAHGHMCVSAAITTNMWLLPLPESCGALETIHNTRRIFDGLCCAVLGADKVEEDLLYHWYRTLYSLFTRAHLVLYHTASADVRCLHVTLMQSCTYQLSFIRITDTTGGIAGTPFLLYPPADFGKSPLRALEQGGRAAFVPCCTQEWDQSLDPLFDSASGCPITSFNFKTNL